MSERRGASADGRILVVANGHKGARAWCEANGIPPRGRHTYIVTSSRAARGFLIRPEDRVVFVGVVDEQIVAAVMPTLVDVGPAHIERVP
jgi:hypothetical protein